MDVKTVTTAELFNHFKQVLVDVIPGQLDNDPTLGGQLILARDGDYVLSYVPFDYIEDNARIVAIGMTPGNRAAAAALKTASMEIKAGRHLDEVLQITKRNGAFAGATRKYLFQMLEDVGAISHIDKSDGTDIHLTSTVRHAIFKMDGDSKPKDFHGEHSLAKFEEFSNLARIWISQEAEALPNAIWVPLGRWVDREFRILIQEQNLQKIKLSPWIPHPAAVDQRSWFLGNQPKNPTEKNTKKFNDLQEQRNLCRAFFGISSVEIDLRWSPPSELDQSISPEKSSNIDNSEVVSQHDSIDALRKTIFNVFPSLGFIRHRNRDGSQKYMDAWVSPTGVVVAHQKETTTSQHLIVAESEVSLEGIEGLVKDIRIVAHSAIKNTLPELSGMRQIIFDPTSSEDVVNILFVAGGHRR